MRLPREDTKPWYRQFWPWFLISLPAMTIVAAIITINLAIETSDGLVKDDYYKEGLAIHMDAARTKAARQLGIQALLTHSPDSDSVTLELNDAAVGQLEELQLTLFHPTRGNQDQQVILERGSNGIFASRITALEQANWRVTVEPVNGSWRISGRLSIPDSTTVRLE